MAQNKRWEAVRGQRPLNERRIATYKRLIHAEQRLARLRDRLSDAEDVPESILEFEVSQATAAEPDGSEADIYLSTLARYVEALGGHLEIRAVFTDETVTVLRLPDGDGA